MYTPGHFKVKYFCKKCGVEEKHHPRLVQHVMTNHQVVPETTSEEILYCCALCETKLNKNAFLTHIQIHSEECQELKTEDIEKCAGFSCGNCKLVTVEKMHIIYHIMTKHEPKRKMDQSQLQDYISNLLVLHCYLVIQV